MHFFERHQGGERAVLVHLDFSSGDSQEELEEFQELVLSAGATPVEVIRGSRRIPDARYFVGSGKAEEIKAVVEKQNADLIIVNHALTPAQERNLEKLVQCRVLDRTGLILDIFAQRARSFEGKLQVELAQLRHLSTRLVRGWSHLERQRGGIGLRGPGETQLETDRRLIGQRIKQLNKRLQKVSQQREERRKPRRRAGLFTVAFVGYTNAGKSTLFNRLTGAQVYAADQLFATLDPTLRRIRLPNGKDVVLADTVGFISRLPHTLVAAFRSTLEETLEADLLLHVVDAHDPMHTQRIAQVNDVLHEIGGGDIPQLEIFNKLDLVADAVPRVDRDENGQARRVWMSAVTGNGIELLLQALGERLEPEAGAGGAHELVRGRVRLSSRAEQVRARLFASDAVVAEQALEDGGTLLDVELARDEWSRLAQEQECQVESLGTAMPRG